MIPKLIILEGPDAAGKTSLSRWICETTGASSFRATYTPALGQAMLDYQMNILDNAEWTVNTMKRTMVLDRHWPSEWVYSQVFRGGVSGPLARGQSLMDQRIAAMNGIYVCCWSDMATQVRRHRENVNPDHPYDDASYQQVCLRYGKWRATMGRLLPEGGWGTLFSYSIEANGRDVSAMTNWFDAVCSTYEDRLWKLAHGQRVSPGPRISAQALYAAAGGVGELTPEKPHA